MTVHRLDRQLEAKITLAPFQIAHNPLFTAREKISLLRRLRAEVTGALENDHDVGLTPGEIDAAIEEVKHEAQSGEIAGAGRKKSGRDASH